MLLSAGFVPLKWECWFPRYRPAPQGLICGTIFNAPNAYQTQLMNDIGSKWDSGWGDVLAVMPTGAGKTVAFSKLNSDWRGWNGAVFQSR